MAKRKVKPYAARRHKPDDEAVDSAPHTVKWWTSETGADAQGRLWTWVDRLRAQWAQDGIGDLIHEAIYADEPLARGGMFDGQRWTANREHGTSPMNVLMSLVDTASARLTKERAMPCISAKNAKYSRKRFAKKLSEVLRTKMGGQDMEEASPLVIRDFCIRGTGCIKTVRKGGDTARKRIPIYEVVYDHREAQFGLPRSIAHVRPEQREVLVKLYPKYAKQIWDAPLFRRTDPWMQFVYQGPSLADLVEIAESWHLPSEPDCEDGQHIICIRGTTVLREPWRVERYPVNFSYWTAPIRGVRGKGLVSEHLAAQDWINDILTDARKGIRHGSQLKVMVPRGANVNKNHLRATDPIAIEVDGPPGQVQFVAADPVSKQAWAIAFQMKEQMYALSGISQWSAEANKPLGNGVSGKALDTMNDNQSDRFAHVVTLLQQFRVAIGRSDIDMAQHLWLEAHGKIPQLYEEQPEPITKAELAAWIRENDWTDLDLDCGDFSLTLEPINFITGSRGGKIEEAAEAGKAGLIPDPSMTAALFDEPDIQRMNRPILGPFHRIESCMEGLANLKIPYMNIAPDNYMNLSLAELMAKGELEELKSEALKGDDPETEQIAQRFMDFLADVKSLKDKAAAGSPSLPGAMPNTQISQPNAGTLQPSMGMPPAMAPGPGTAGPGLPTGIAA